MSYSSKKPCFHFKKPSGCRAGDACRFSHDVEQSQSPTSPSSPRSSGSGPAHRDKRPCHFYLVGRCRRGSDCQFSHERDIAPTSAVQSVQPLLGSQGISNLDITNGDIFRSVAGNLLSAAEVRDLMKKYMHDNFRFDKTFSVYAFWVPFQSAHRLNKNWTDEDGQVLLNTIATGNPILRLNDIVLWPTVSLHAGSSARDLSFQRGYFPLLSLLSADFVVKSTRNHLVHALYMRILDNLDHFAAHLEDCVEVAFDLGSFEDIRMPFHLQAGSSISGFQLLIALATVLFECLTRFKNAVATYPRLATLVDKLSIWVELWVQKISANPPTLNDPQIAQSRPDTHAFMITHLREKVERLSTIVTRERNKAQRSAQPRAFGMLGVAANEGIVSALQILQTDAEPGHLRPDGPRHDNDHADINDIRIAPTEQELVCAIAPYLPANFFEAPHHQPPESMERLLDIQFRLLREEGTAPLRTSIQLVRNDILNKDKKKTQLSALIQKGGGKYKGFVSNEESVMFNVYTNVEFLGLAPDRRGIAVKMTFDAPPGRARSSKAKDRAAFWEGMSGKRLIQGGLLALVWKEDGGNVGIHLGILATTVKEITEFVKTNEARVVARVVFFDAAVQLRILHGLKGGGPGLPGLKLLVESPVMFEAIRPFLEALRVEPEALPFKQYLPHRPAGFLRENAVLPPKYARMPGFQYQLAPLFPDDSGVTDLKLSPTDPFSIADAREALKAGSRLDPSQADAVVDTLIREVALVQGPPGTGKSFVGIEMLRVLLATVRPVLMIAFTNHALDHMLTGVLDAGITKKIVRLGSRSASERIAEFSMENLEMVAGKSMLDRSLGHHFYKLKEAEKEIDAFMKQFMRTDASPDDIMRYLQMQYPEHYELLSCADPWVFELYEQFKTQEEGWTRVAGPRHRQETEDTSLYTFWLKGIDITFLSTPKYPPSRVEQSKKKEGSAMKELANRFESLRVESESGETDVPNDDTGSHEEEDDDDDDEEEPWLSPEAWPEGQVPSEEGADVPVESPKPTQPVSTSTIKASARMEDVEQGRESIIRSNVEHFFSARGYISVPATPRGDRELDMLLAVGEVWLMSQAERERLHAYWERDLIMRRASTHEEDFDALRRKHQEAQTEYNEGRDEVRRQLLNNTDIVGCTTTGAARLSSLLKGLSPRVLLVEEAGQVLEAHILGSLVPTIEHLILIGDPLQLRPTLNNYALSMDSQRGQKLYRFDMSLMERLSSSGFPMSQIDVQRRMRPEISNLIRTTLYPNLIDNTIVKSYPDVRGFTKNVFFLDHQHPENDGNAEDNSSKYNMYEVDMIRDMVMYLLRQGCYSQEGDIVVLCAYLGQLAKVRDALHDLVAVVIDERDQTELADREEEEVEELRQESQVNHVKITSRVRLRTVDNYQGEEAKIIILSLVRNAGSNNGLDGSLTRTIGFLRSENRTNVALSRAKEGLYILGNKAQFSSRSPMWKGVIDELEAKNCVGRGFPVACHRHPESNQIVSEPGVLPMISPDGGCLESCNARLKCGHVCPYKCHPDDPTHLGVECVQKCTRLCSRDLHPCQKECSDECGKCTHKISNVALPCGHVAPFVLCHQMDALDDVNCDFPVIKQLEKCEHSAELACSEDPSTVLCRQRCNLGMDCCGRSCGANCADCQHLNAGGQEGQLLVRRINHQPHKCQRLLYCAHACTNSCSRNHECTKVCKEECRQECAHSKCKNYCSRLCSPCKEACTWRCAHVQCPVPCGSICLRFPCDVRCKNELKCGHPCPSVCGEDCYSQICVTCADGDAKDSVVDLVMQRKLSDIPVDSEDPDDILITLPKCGHVFTMETLDGVCGIKDWYDYDELTGKWTGLRVPESKAQPPVCPSCRASITSPRYGRIFKAADLNILEHNVITSMSQGIGGVQRDVATIDVEAVALGLSRALSEVKSISSKLGGPQTNKARKKSRAAVFADKSRSEPIDAGKFIDDKLFPFSAETTRIWRTAIQPIVKLLTEVTRTAKVRPAHVHAWESSFTYLYNQEIEQAIQDPRNAPRNPEEHAMRMARMKLGQTQPRADRRFLVEAIWLALTLRFKLVELVCKVLEVMAGKPEIFTQDERSMWAQYGHFILKSCGADSSLAYTVAEESRAHRQMTTSRRFGLRTELELFRFRMTMSRHSKTFTKERERYLEHAQQHHASAVATIDEIAQDHIRKLPMDETWLQENFVEAASLLLDEWESIEKSVRQDTFYEPVSLEEKKAIVGALNFSHTGHWYNCPNGHTFVIGECGGAMETARCPECNESIGGRDHRLLGTNRRDNELERLSAEHGAAESPWTWGN